MFRQSQLPVLVAAILATQISCSINVSAQSAKFDVASVIECIDVEKAKTSDKPSPTDARLIHIPVLISSDLDQRSREMLTQLRVDIQFLQKANEVADYSPRTDTFSEISGPISVENHRERSANLGIQFSGSYQPVKGSANAGAGAKNRSVEKFQKTPERKLVAASGTRNRRTGVYFKFLPSTQNPWDGERELAIIARVPRNWRAGLLRIEIRADGQRQRIPGIKEDVTIAHQKFEVLIVRNGDRKAIETARQFHALSTRCRKLAQNGSKKRGGELDWKELRNFNSTSTSLISIRDLDRLLIRPILTESDQQKLKRAEASARKTIERFVQARRDLLVLNSDPRIAAKNSTPHSVGWVKKQ